MTSITFDTLKYTKRLEEAGFSRPQAEAQAHALAAQELATKADIFQLRHEMAQMEIRLIKWMAGMSAAIIGILFTLIRFMPHG